MKTALGSGSQHRKKDLNDSRGKEINNAGLPLSLYPSVPHFPPIPLCIYSFVYFSNAPPVYGLPSLVCLFLCDDYIVASRGSANQQASTPPPHLFLFLEVSVQTNCKSRSFDCCSINDTIQFLWAFASVDIYVTLYLCCYITCNPAQPHLGHRDHWGQEMT